MVGKAILAALAACAGVCAASAEETGDGLDLGMLHWIRDTVCTTGEPVLFIPVSDDVPTLDRTYAVVQANHLDTDTAHVVTPRERAWLSTNGCTTPQPRRTAAIVRRSGGLDF